MNKEKLLVAAGFAIAIAGAHLLDGWVFEHLQLPRLAESDLGRMLRVLGFLPLWIIVAAAVALGAERSIPAKLRRRRGWLVVGSAALGGIVAEGLKILLRRERPAAGVDGYRFRPWSEETFATAGLGLPSSHALVAFAAFAMLGILYPRARPLWWALAAGCAFSRLAAGAHFLSDVVAAAAIGYAVAVLLARAWPPDGPVARPAD